MRFNQVSSGRTARFGLGSVSVSADLHCNIPHLSEPLSLLHFRKNRTEGIGSHAGVPHTHLVSVLVFVVVGFVSVVCF